MKIIDFINSPCPVCDSADYDLYYMLNNKMYNFYKGKDSIRINSLFSINLISNEIEPANDKITDGPYIVPFIKKCKCDSFKSSTNIFYIDAKRDLKLPKIYIIYETFKIRITNDIDERATKDGGSINFHNDYLNNHTFITTTDGYKQLPLIPLSKLNLKDPKELISKLESLIILL